MKIFIFVNNQKIFILFFFFYCINAAKKECETDKDCQLNWPYSVCRRYRCACKSDSIRRASNEAPNGWVCLSLFDAGLYLL